MNLHFVGDSCIFPSYLQFSFHLCMIGLGHLQQPQGQRLFRVFLIILILANLATFPCFHFDFCWNYLYPLYAVCFQLSFESIHIFEILTIQVGQEEHSCLYRILSADFLLVPREVSHRKFFLDRNHHTRFESIFYRYIRCVYLSDIINRHRIYYLSNFHFHINCFLILFCFQVLNFFLSSEWQVWPNCSQWKMDQCWDEMRESVFLTP